jgi:hypothetical protein
MVYFTVYGNPENRMKFLGLKIHWTISKLYKLFNRLNKNIDYKVFAISFDFW